MYELLLISRSNLFAGTEVLRELLVNQGVSQSQIAELHNVKGKGVIGYFKKKEEVNRIGYRIKKLRLKGVSLRISNITRRDWGKEWQRSVQPFAIARQFEVVPVGGKQKGSQNGRIPIQIEMSLAFGTGLHETTQFMAQLIERCQGQFNAFLDVGTGTGILTILAAKCGAKKLWALDVDPSALTIARGNFMRNKVRNVKIIKGDIRDYAPQCRFDLVAANLYTLDLIRFRRKIYSLVQPGKFLAVSGISRDHLRDFQESYKKFTLRCLRVCRGKQWAAILFQRIAR
jgi:ribosomal protein L11 methyltransferase